MWKQSIGRDLPGSPILFLTLICLSFHPTLLPKPEPMPVFSGPAVSLTGKSCMILYLMGRNKVTFDFSTAVCTSGEHWVVVHLWDIFSPSLKYMEEEEEGAWRCTGGSNWKALGGCRLGMCRLKGKEKCCYIILAQRDCSFVGFWCNFLYIHLLEENFQASSLRTWKRQWEPMGQGWGWWDGEMNSRPGG